MGESQNIPASSLTRFSATENGRVYHIYAYGDERYRVYDDAENALLIIKLFADESLKPQEKFAVLMQMLFVAPERVVEVTGAALGELLVYLAWEVAGLDIDGSHTYEVTEPCFDWEEDAERIKATLLAVYGVKWDELKTTVTYRELCGLLTYVPHESPFGQAVYYRTAREPEQTKYNEEQIKHFREAKQFYALKGHDADQGAENHKAYDAFNMLARLAK